MPNPAEARPRPALRLLFLCTGNSARSILAEALLNRLGEGRFVAFSAGTKPKGSIHPRALAALARAGVPTAGLASQGIERFAGESAHAIDLVVTLCDAAAAEPCPILPGAPASVHWGLADPTAAAGSDEERDAAFDRTLRELEGRIRRLVALPPRSLEPARLAAEAREIHERAG
jgi:arsenate reductase